MKKIKPLKLVLIALPVLLILGACSLLPGAAQPTEDATTVVSTVASSSAVISEGRLVPRENKFLTFLTGGEVLEVMVAKGDVVNQGDILASLSGSEGAAAGVTAANLELEAAQQAIDDLNRLAELAKLQAQQELINAKNLTITTGRAWDAVDTDQTQEDIDQANIDVADAKKTLSDAQDEFDKYKDLPDDNTTRKNAEDDLKQAQSDYDELVRTRDELVNARDLTKANYNAALAALSEAQRTYDSLQSGPDPDQLSLAEKRLENANAQLTAAQASLDNFVLKAPLDGTIVDLDIIPGQVVSPATMAFLLVDFSQWYVETQDLTELEVVKIQEGQTVTITPDALPDVTLTGKIVEISQVASSQAGDVVYTVRILLDQSDPQLRWGMTMEVNFDEN